MSTIILNDYVVSERIKAHEAEMVELQKPVTRADAELFIKRLDDYDLTKLLPKDTVVGTVRFAVSRGQRQPYGFISSPVGDVFVPPRLMEGQKDDERVAAQVEYDNSRRRAVNMVDVWKYVSWHEDEILNNAAIELKTRLDRDLERLTTKDPTGGWEEMKAKCKALGLELCEIVKETKSVNYGGRGSDSYRFSTPITEEKASEVLTVLGGRHAEANPAGPYDPGHDRIVLTEDGFRNDWCGPWTD